MRIVAYSSSLNGKQQLKALIEALLSQTYPTKEILVVENGSTGGTPLESFPPQVTFITHPRNLGTSGAAATAFQYAQSRGYEWLWALDQDTIPKPDALEKLVDLYRSFDPGLQERTGILSSLVILHPTDMRIHGRRLTPGGVRPAKVNPARACYECDATIWSGSLYNLKAVREVGLPRFGLNGCWEDFSLDYGDIEFSSRIKQAGYKVFGHNFSHIVHPVGKTKHLRLLTRTIYSTNHSPFRRYLYFRNMIYFWLYVYPHKNILILPLYLTYRLLANCAKICLIEDDRTRKIQGCLVGVWDGLRRQLHHRHFFDSGSGL
jgi:GT2 family glycosyltransferase